MTPLSQFARVSPSVAPLAVNHQGQFPSVTLSFNLAPNATIGEAVPAVQETVASLKLPSSIATSFQGNAQAFQSSLSSTPILILAALVAVYLILGMLYESLVHPLTIISTPAVGRARRFADPDAVRHAARRHRHHRHHPLDRHREEERHHAGRLRARAPARRVVERKTPFMRRADCASVRSS